MRKTQSLSITLPNDMAKMVKDKVISGEYATESEVIRDGLRLLAARDAAVKKWLLEEVAPTYDKVMADSARMTQSAEDAWRKLEAHMDAEGVDRTDKPATGGDLVDILGDSPVRDVVF